MMLSPLAISLPDWVADEVDFSRLYDDDCSRMAVAVHVARQNVERDSGGPFGAAIFEQRSGRLISVGVNRVVPLHNCTLHAEMLAFMFAQRTRASHTLNDPTLPAHTLYTSCAPCAMCLGASLWSGVRRIVIAARREDAQAIGFEEGPVFPQSETYLQARGIEIVPDVMRDEGNTVLQRYAELDRLRYNG
jgi:tRNA(Arg) A34 adenosine deaminase TadA